MLLKRTTIRDELLRVPSRKTAVSGIDKPTWLGELENVSLSHGSSLLQGRRLEHPHDTPPYPFTPSPTSAHSSLLRASQ